MKTHIKLHPQATPNHMNGVVTTTTTTLLCSDRRALREAQIEQHTHLYSHTSSKEKLDDTSRSFSPTRSSSSEGNDRAIAVIFLVTVKISGNNYEDDNNN